MYNWEDIARDPRNRQTLAAILVDVLETACDERRLPCPVATFAAAFLLQSAETGLRVNHPEVLRSCSRFLCTPRTAEELEALAASPHPVSGHCPCARGGAFAQNRILARIHEQMRGNMFSALVTVLEAVTPLLCNVMDNVYVTKTPQSLFRTARNAAVYGRKRPWPAGQHDILPFGAQESIEALCAWTEYLPKPHMLRLVNWAYILGTDESMPSILLQTIIPRVLMPVVKHSLQQAASHRPASTGHMDAIISLHSAAQILHFLLLWDNAQLLRAIGPRRAQYAALIDLCDDAHTVINVAVSQWDAEELPEVLQISFGGTAGRLRSVLGMPDGIALRDMWERDIEGSYYSLAGYARFLGRDVRCARVGCAERPLSLGRRLHACSGCGRVYYCSRACQKEGWRDARGAHRAICGTIKKITEQLQVAAQDEGARPYDADHRKRFHDLCVSAGVDASAAQSVAEYLQSVYGR